MTDLRQDWHPDVTDSSPYSHYATLGPMPLCLLTKVHLPLSQRQWKGWCFRPQHFSPAVGILEGSLSHLITELLQVHSANSTNFSNPEYLMKQVELFWCYSHCFPGVISTRTMFCESSFRLGLGKDWGQGQLHGCVTKAVTQEPRAWCNVLLVLILEFSITLSLNLWSLRDNEACMWAEMTRAVCVYTIVPCCLSR